jgi:hypothetical protein
MEAERIPGYPQISCKRWRIGIRKSPTRVCSMDPIQILLAGPDNLLYAGGSALAVMVAAARGRRRVGHFFPG